MSAKSYKMITFQVESEVVNYSRHLASLWMATTMPVNGLIGNRVKISICNYREFSCPYRPIKEFFVSVAIAIFLLFFAFVVWWFYIYLPEI